MCFPKNFAKVAELDELLVLIEKFEKKQKFGKEST